MEMYIKPSGEERPVRSLETVAVAGAPIAYIVVLAGVVMVLAGIPFSVMLGAGNGFPLSQAIYPLVGWILGPVAGALAAGVGGLLGVFLFPQNSAVPIATVLGAVAGGFAGGILGGKGRWAAWGLPIAVFFGVVYAFYAGSAIVLNGVDGGIFLLASFINWSALALFVLPTRKLFRSWLSSADLKRVTPALFLGTWCVAGLSHLTAAFIVYQVMGWPDFVWASMIPVSPLEHLMRAAVGAVIGSGVLAGLRAVGLVKPKYAAY